MGIDRLERGAQPFAPFVIERADRSAQAAHRLHQFGAVGDRAVVFGLCPGQVIGGDQVNRANPFAFRQQPVVIGTDRAGAADVFADKSDPGGQ